MYQCLVGFKRKVYKWWFTNGDGREKKKNGEQEYEKKNGKNKIKKKTILTRMIIRYVLLL